MKNQGSFRNSLIAFALAIACGFGVAKATQTYDQVNYAPTQFQNAVDFAATGAETHEDSEVHTGSVSMATAPNWVGTFGGTATRLTAVLTGLTPTTGTVVCGVQTKTTNGAAANTATNTFILNGNTASPTTQYIRSAINPANGPAGTRTTGSVPCFVDDGTEWDDLGQ